MSNLILIILDCIGIGVSSDGEEEDINIGISIDVGDDVNGVWARIVLSSSL